METPPQHQPKSQPEFSYYARRRAANEETQEENKPQAMPVSPTDRYFAVGSRSFYTGEVGAMMRKDKIDGRSYYWLELVGRGVAPMYFRADELIEITYADFQNHYQNWLKMVESNK